MKMPRPFSRLLFTTMAPCVLLGFSLHEAPGAHAADQPRRIEVTARRFAFSPAEITVKKGEPVVLALHSEDVTHGLRVPELNIQAEIPKGSVAEVPFTAATVGDFSGRCGHFCGEQHGSMTFKVHVTE